MEFTSKDYYALPFIRRIFCGMKNVIYGVFSQYNRMFGIAFFFTVTYTTYINYKEKIGNSLVNKISLVSTVIVLISTLFNSNGYFFYSRYLFDNNVYQCIILIIHLFQLLLMFYSSAIYLIKYKQYKILNILIAALLSQACMVVVPGYPLRSSIIFQVLCYIYVIYNFVRKYENSKDKKIVNLVFVCVFALAFVNVMNISVGYYKNSSINIKNDETLKRVSQEIKQGEKINKVTLDKVLNMSYSGEQPYIEGFKYIEGWIKEYYNLPTDFILEYK